MKGEDLKKVKKLIEDQDKEIEDLTAKLDKFKQEYAYQLAENDNTVKRYKGEIEKTKKFAVSKFAKDLLEVRDQLEMAMNHTKIDELDPENSEAFQEALKQLYNGVDMTAKTFDSVMNRFEVKSFDPIGDKFDPTWHEAMFMIPDKDKKAGTVGQVLQNGWKIGDRVLRAAKVGCVKH